MTHTPSLRTRFAPSPSGHLHVGGARTALFNWAYAHGRGGKFILRIEDTDQKRSSDAASVGFLKDLKWLGIDWNEGPEFEGCGGGDFGSYFQSERLDMYNKFLEQLVQQGKAYYAFDTTAELDVARKESKSRNEAYRYDRSRADAISPEQVQAWLKEGKPAVIRFKTPAGAIAIHDEILGDATLPAGEVDDFVIRKADGFPTYHFAVVVDDELMGVTTVLRAQEHFNNTAKHRVKSPQTLEKIWFESVGRGCNLLLNIPVDSRGLVAPQELASLKEWGNLQRAMFAVDFAPKTKVSATSTRLASSMSAFAAANVTDGNPATYWATDDAVTSGTLEFLFPSAISPRVIRIEEAIQLGQRVDAFHVELRGSDGVWRKTVQGTTIGVRRILRLEGEGVNGVRVVIDESRACPCISRVSIY
ncbi:MAG: glutamate--tRNA ligase family protein [Planctomycetota bacterium]|nr:glutamate--tRNA ligase family protein [Planctomycetota bacterium]